MTATRHTTVVKDYINAGVVRTYYEVHGSGEPIVLLHGGFCTIDTWGAQTADLARRYRVYLPERRGHGRSPDVDGPITYENMAQDTIAFMDALNISSSHVVGWSDGGNVAMFIAMLRPDLVRKMVVISAPADFEGGTEAAKAQLETMTLDQLPPMLRQSYEMLSPDGPEHISAVFAKTLRLWGSDRAPGMDALAEIGAPTLLMLADDDLVTIEHAAAMARSLPNSQLAVVPGTDHALIFEKPDLVNRLIADFLADEQAPKVFA